MMTLKTISKLGFIIVLFTAAVVNTGFAVECRDITLSGVYSVLDLRKGSPTNTQETWVQIIPISYMQGVYRVSTVQKTEEEYQEVKPGWFRNYTLATLTTRNLPSEEQSTCAIAWYDPSRAGGDFEFNLILQKKSSGSLLLGGDFETTDLYLFKRIQ